MTAASGDSVPFQDSHCEARPTRMTTTTSKNMMMVNGHCRMGSSTPSKELEPREIDAVLALHEVRKYTGVEQEEVLQATGILLDLKGRQMPNNTGPYAWETAQSSKAWSPFDARHVIHAIRQDKHKGSRCAYSRDKRIDLSLSDTITDSEIDSGPENQIEDTVVKGVNGSSIESRHGQTAANKERRVAQSSGKRQSSNNGVKRIKRLSSPRSPGSTSKQPLRIITPTEDPFAGMNGEGSSSQLSNKGSLEIIATPLTDVSPKSTYDTDSAKYPSPIHNEVNGNRFLTVKGKTLDGSAAPSTRRPSGPKKRSDYGKALIEVTELDDTVEVKFEKLVREGAFMVMEGRSMRSRSRRPTLEA